MSVTSKSVWLAVALILTCWQSAAAEEFVSNGVKIHYVQEGTGDPVILVHGLYSSARANWQAPGIMDALAKRYRVIALDNRGHGQSGKPADESQYGVEMVNDIARLMDHLHIAKAHIVGYSLGGIITMKFLTMYPQRVSTAVLGGMGWLPGNPLITRIWERMQGSPRMGVPPACVHSVGKLGTTANQVRAIKVPFSVIAGDQDPCRRMYINPLLRLRPDVPDYSVAGAGHLTCIARPEFQADLCKALESGR